jgi:ABC-2 type transport system ATP-binding protein
MIRVEGLTKRYGAQVAVDDLSFEVGPGRVTGFLGPNGAGKSTTLRLLVGLQRPDAGRALVAGVRYADLVRPLHTVGALLDGTGMHGGRTLLGHLLGLARSHRIPSRRVDEVLQLVGLSAVAGRRAAALSLGMRQRAGIAAALLGDPAVLLLDEPTNGLDPEGILWVRGLLKDLAAQGRTVLVSSHLITEMSLTAEHVVVLARGRLLADSPVETFVREHARGAVRLRVADRRRMRALLANQGIRADDGPDGTLMVVGADVETVGERGRHRTACPRYSTDGAVNCMKASSIAVSCRVIS